MAIPKVEPLTTARALRGPFDYRLPAAMEDLEVGSVVRVPFGPRRLLGVVVELAEASELPPERLAEPIEALEAGAPPELVRLGLWVAARVLLDPLAGPAAGAAAGDRRRAGAARPRRKRELRAEITAGGRGGAERRRAARGQAAGGAGGAAGGGDVGARELAARGRLRPRRSCGGSSERGLIATRSSRVRRAPGAAGRRRRRPSGPQLLPEQEAAVERDRRRPRRRGGRAARAAPARRHRLGQDRGLPGRGRGGAGARPRGDRPRPRDRPRAAGGGPLPRPARRPLRRPALGPLRRRALRRVAAPAQRRGERLRRPPLGRLRPGPRPRPDRDRRGARPLLQAGGRPLLRRPRRRPPAAPRTAAPCSSPAPRRRGRSPGWSCRGWSCRAGSTAAACRRSSCVDMREADPRSGPLHPDTWEALEEVRAAGAKAIVMINRRGFAPWLTCRSCGHHWDCPNCDVSLIVHRHSGRLVCHHCAHAEPLPRACPRLRLDHALAGRRRHRADRGAAGRAAGADAGLPARLRHRRRRAAPTPASSPRFGEARQRRPGRHPDGRQGPRLPRGDAERDPRRRRDPALPRLPRRGADLRDGRPARRSQRPRRGRRRGDRPDPGARARRASRTPPATTPPASSPASSSGAGRCATRPSRTWSGSASPAEREARLEARRRGARRRSCARRCPTDSELLGPAPMFRVRNRHRRRLLIKADRSRRRPSPRCARRSSACAADRALRTSRSASTSTRSRAAAMRAHRRSRALDSDRVSEPSRRPTSDERERARSGAAGAPRGRARPRGQVRRPGAEEQGLAGRRLRPGAAGRGRADGRDHARRDGRRPRRHPARRSCAACSSSRPAPTASRPRWSTPRSSGSPRRSSVAEEGCLSLPRVSMDVERPLHARVSGRDVEGEPIMIEASGLEARVLQHEIDHLDGVLILDRTAARPAQGRAAGAARGRQLQPAAPRRTSDGRGRAARAAHRRVRTVYLGTSEFAATVLRRLAELAAPPGARRHPARPAARGRGRKLQRRRRPPRPRRELGIELLQADDVNDEAALERIRAARPEAVAVCAFGQLIREPLLSRVPAAQRPPLAAAALARRGADRAGDHGRRRATGVCVMQLTAGLDSGPVALREEVADRPRGGLRGALGEPRGARRRAAGPGPRPAGRGRARVRRAGRGRRSTYAEKIEPGRAPPRPVAPGERAGARRSGPSPRTSAPTWRRPTASGSACAAPRAVDVERRDRARCRPSGGRCCSAAATAPCGSRWSSRRAASRWRPTPTCAATRCRSCERRASDLAGARARLRDDPRRPSRTAPSPSAPSAPAAERRGLDGRERAQAQRLAYGAVQRRGTSDAAIERLAERSTAAARPAGARRAAARPLRAALRRRDPRPRRRRPGGRAGQGRRRRPRLRPRQRGAAPRRPRARAR